MKNEIKVHLIGYNIGASLIELEQEGINQPTKEQLEDNVKSEIKYMLKNTDYKVKDVFVDTDWGWDGANHIDTLVTIETDEDQYLTYVSVLKELGMVVYEGE